MNAEVDHLYPLPVLNHLTISFGCCSFHIEAKFFILAGGVLAGLALVWRSDVRRACQELSCDLITQFFLLELSCSAKSITHFAHKVNFLVLFRRHFLATSKLFGIAVSSKFDKITIQIIALASSSDSN